MVGTHPPLCTSPMIIVMMLKIMIIILKKRMLKIMTCSRFEGLMVGTHPPLCTSPMIEINGTRAPHPAASQADAYLFQVGDNGDGCGDGDMVIIMVC